VIWAVEAVALLILVLFGHEIIRVAFGAHFVRAYYPILLMCIAFPLAATSSLLCHFVLIPLGGDKSVMLGSTLGVIINSTLGLYLAQRYGAIGMTTTRIIAEFAILLFIIGRCIHSVRKAEVFSDRVSVTC
jgi:O-antigen/teichoic acid export membrane protein